VRIFHLFHILKVVHYGSRDAVSLSVFPIASFPLSAPGEAGLPIRPPAVTKHHQALQKLVSALAGSTRVRKPRLLLA
jgi:hypothetical protein